MLMHAVVQVRTREYTACFSNVREFNKWGYSKDFLVRPPVSATNINVLVYPGSDIYNMDYYLTKKDFVLYITNKFSISEILLSSFISVPPFCRGGDFATINRGYFIDYTNIRPVIVGVYYDIKSSKVSYRQSGRFVKWHIGHLTNDTLPKSSQSGRQVFFRSRVPRKEQ